MKNWMLTNMPRVNYLVFGKLTKTLIAEHSYVYETIPSLNKNLNEKSEKGILIHLWHDNAEQPWESITLNFSVSSVLHVTAYKASKIHRDVWVQLIILHVLC